MGFKLKSSKNDPMSEINVTPFVDVMLVLLIVFMITAPLLQTGVELNLPEVDTPNLPESNKPLIISINKDLQIFISNKNYDIDGLKEKLSEIKNANPKIKVFLRADKTVTYEFLMIVMKQIIDGNISNVSLITEPNK